MLGVYLAMMIIPQFLERVYDQMVEIDGYLSGL